MRTCSLRNLGSKGEYLTIATSRTFLGQPSSHGKGSVLVTEGFPI